MKMRIILGGLLTVVVCVLTVSTISGQDGRLSREEKERNIQAALKLHAPGENHRKLDIFAGTWTTVWKVWHEPDSEPSDVTRGTAKFDWILGKRFLRGVYTGERMMGRSFAGELLLGYNGPHGHYEAIWANSFETDTSTFTGSANVNASGVVSGLSLSGKGDDCPSGRRDVLWRAEFRFVGKDKIVEEEFGPDRNGKEFKAVEVTYTRVRSKR